MAQNEAQRLRRQVEDVATIVDTQRKFRRPCFQLILRDYGPRSRSRTATLRRLSSALEAIRIHPDARQISMAKLRATMTEIKYFREDQPDQAQDVGGLAALNAVAPFYMRDRHTSRLYGYEVGSISKAWHLVKLNRRYLVDSEVLDDAQVVANNELHADHQGMASVCAGTAWETFPGRSNISRPRFMDTHHANPSR